MSIETDVSVIDIESLSESSDIENLCKVPQYLMGAHHFRLSSLNATLSFAMSVNDKTLKAGATNIVC